MSKSMIGPAGGLSAEDRAKLIPKNIRAGVHFFDNSLREVVGNYVSMPVFIAAWHYAWRASQGGSSAVFDSDLVTASVPGSGETATITVKEDFKGVCYVCGATFSGNGVTITQASGNGTTVDFKTGQVYNFSTAEGEWVNVAGAVTLIKAG